MDTTEKRIVPEELDNLIQEYLTDGIISAKERQVLLNKAQSLGLNLDEVDLYIDAQQQKADQAIASAVNKRRGKTCPFCGSSIPELTDKCPNCGSNITPEASEELAEIIEHLESALVNFKSGEDIDKSKAEVERYARQARMYYGNNPKIQRLLEEVEVESEEALRAAKKRPWLNLLEEKKDWFLFIAFLAVVCIIAVVGTATDLFTPAEQSASKTTRLVEKAIEEGDLAQAQVLIDNYSKRWFQSSSDIQSACDALSEAEKKQEQEGLNKAIEAGNYDSALEGISRRVSYDVDDAQKYYDTLCKCLDAMKEKGVSKVKLKKFINRKIEVYREDAYPEEWSKANVKKRLYEYIN
ncbi:zinc ribbon domain-containing protein [uncultured Prevotella sp.]|uniref:zinc ribbon domain-containing protein n=1 Tax=uncultured Prevotella sp. TaxID=159272 RepID=UPI0027E39DB6|nr:zinc ribbon domain-containing protein [uncultured Prevotella sp.]